MVISNSAYLIYRAHLPELIYMRRIKPRIAQEIRKLLEPNILGGISIIQLASPSTQISVSYELADAVLSFDTDKVLKNTRKALYLGLGSGARVFYITWQQFR